MRTDAIRTIKIPKSEAAQLLQRLGPLERRYWFRQGGITLQQLILSAYIQGLTDAVNYFPQTP